MKKSRTFEIVFINKKTADTKSILYTLSDNEVAAKWIKCMKHLRNIEPYSMDSNLVQPRNIRKVYKEFCQAAKIKPIKFNKIDQNLLNSFHEQYMDYNMRLAVNEDRHLLYEFHQAIHHAESEMDSDNFYRYTQMHQISYSYKAAAFQEEFPCNRYYSSSLKKDNLYLLYSDSGKKPYNYYYDGEPPEFEKVKKTMVSHRTFIPNWFVCLQDRDPGQLPSKFYDFFEPFKAWFLKTYNLDKWDHVDENSAVLLATPSTDQDVADLLLHQGYEYSHIKLD